MALQDSRIERSSRRRRWLAIRQADQAVPPEPVESLEDVESPGDEGLEFSITALTDTVSDRDPVVLAREEPAEGEAVSGVAAKPAPEASVTSERAGRTVPRPVPERVPSSPHPTQALAVLRGMLSRPASLTWMFLGDSLDPVEPVSREWRSFGGRLVETIRQAPVRLRDVFIDNMVPRQRLSDLGLETGQRLGRFRPDLVVVSISPAEATASRRGLPAFERTLTELVRALAESRAVPILCTPPHIPTGESTASVDQLLYAAAVRAFAAEYDLLLVDHFAHWEAAAESPLGNTNWFASGLETPGRLGHEQLARQFFVDLELAPAPDPR